MQEGEAYIVSAQRLDAPNGESAAREMEELLWRRLPSFYRSVYRFLGNAADAEDAVQDALLSAYKHLDQFRGQSQMSTWLTAIVSNCARMQLRRRPSQIHVSLDERIGEERSEEHTSELQSPCNLVCRLLLEKKKTQQQRYRPAAQRHSSCV